MEAEFRVEFRIQNWSCKENLPRGWETINGGNRRLKRGFFSRTWSRSKVGEVRKRETEGRAEYTEKERNEGEFGSVSGKRGVLHKDWVCVNEHFFSISLNKILSLSFYKKKKNSMRFPFTNSSLQFTKLEFIVLTLSSQ